jgi:hypothetical protein
MERPPHESRFGDQSLETEHAIALASLEGHAEFASVLVAVSTRTDSLDKNLTGTAKERLSEARLDNMLKRIDVCGKAYLRLVTNLESAKAVNVILKKCLYEAWALFSGLHIESVHPTPLFAESPTPLVCLQRDQMIERTKKWQVKAFRRVASLAQPSVHKVEGSSTLSKQLDELIARLDITHDELARRIKIGKTTYFAVKAGGGKRSTRLKVEQYVKKLNESELQS